MESMFSTGFPDVQLKGPDSLTVVSLRKRPHFNWNNGACEIRCPQPPAKTNGAWACSDWSDILTAYAVRMQGNQRQPADTDLMCHILCMSLPDLTLFVDTVEVMSHKRGNGLYSHMNSQRGNSALPIGSGRVCVSWLGL